MEDERRTVNRQQRLPATYIWLAPLPFAASATCEKVPLNQFRDKTSAPRERRLTARHGGNAGGWRKAGRPRDVENWHKNNSVSGTDSEVHTIPSHVIRSDCSAVPPFSFPIVSGNQAALHGDRVCLSVKKTRSHWAVLTCTKSWWVYTDLSLVLIFYLRKVENKE